MDKYIEAFTGQIFVCKDTKQTATFARKYIPVSLMTLTLLQGPFCNPLRMKSGRFKNRMIHLIGAEHQSELRACQGNAIHLMVTEKDVISILEYSFHPFCSGLFG